MAQLQLSVVSAGQIGKRHIELMMASNRCTLRSNRQLAFAMVLPRSLKNPLRPMVLAKRTYRADFVTNCGTNATLDLAAMPSLTQFPQRTYTTKMNQPVHFQ
jgi:hypothetical protein